jgi:hypothetical protein
MSAGIGTPATIEGRGAEAWDHFETEYLSTVAGVRYPRRMADLSKERFGSTLMQCSITRVAAQMAFATTKVLRIYDVWNNLLFTEGLVVTALGVSELISEENPLVGPMGSPLFVEIGGTGGYTDGNLAVTGYVRMV